MNTPIDILLVEDSPSDADVLQQTLEQAGAGHFRFTWVERLSDALVRLREEAFDVLLLDLSLPDSSGPETFRRAQKAAPGLPIVVLTGTKDESVGLAAVREGVQDYLVKGQADGPQIARAIRYAIGRAHAEEQMRQAQKMESVGLLAAGVAHDFNNLLTTILTMCQMLQSELPADSAVQADLEAIRGAAEHGSELTRKLLAFSRHQRLQMRSVAVEPLVREFLRMARRVVPEDVEVDLAVEADGASVVADAVPT